MSDKPDILLEQTTCPVCGWKFLTPKVDRKALTDGHFHCPFCKSALEAEP